MDELPSEHIGIVNGAEYGPVDDEREGFLEFLFSDVFTEWLILHLPKRKQSVSSVVRALFNESMLSPGEDRKHVLDKELFTALKIRLSELRNLGILRNGGPKGYVDIRRQAATKWLQAYYARDLQNRTESATNHKAPTETASIRALGSTAIPNTAHIRSEGADTEAYSPAQDPKTKEFIADIRRGQAVGPGIGSQRSRRNR